MILRPHLCQPALDVLSGRATGIAGRQQVDIDGPALAHRSCAQPAEAQRRQGGQVPLAWSHEFPSLPAPARAPVRLVHVLPIVASGGQDL